MAKAHKEYRQGIFKPSHKEKCVNTDKIVYRSSLEQKLMFVLDRNPNVISWGSENVIIPYMKPNFTENGIRSDQLFRPARYFVDFYAKMKLPNDKIQEFLFEVKPVRQTKLDKNPHGNKKESTILYEKMQFDINKRKWDAAKEYCKKKNWIFLIITEQNISSILDIK